MSHRDVDLEKLAAGVVTPVADEQERRAEVSLRPGNLEDFVGQRELVRHLEIVLGSAKARNQSADHLLFAGPPGLGKTSLASIVAVEMGSGLRITSGPVLSRPGDLAALLTDLQDGDVLFIDEIHRLSRAVEEVLYPAHGRPAPGRHDRTWSLGEVDPAGPAELHARGRDDAHRSRGGAAARPVRLHWPARPLRRG